MKSSRPNVNNARCPANNSARTSSFGGNRKSSEVVAVESLSKSAASMNANATRPLHTAQLAIEPSRLLDMLHGAIEESADSFEANRSAVSAELRGLQSRAIISSHARALATIERVEARGGASAMSGATKAQIEHSRRQCESLLGQVANFFATARGLVDLMSQTLSKNAADFYRVHDRSLLPNGGEVIFERLKTLTPRQRCVLRLLTQGKPNKVIAHELNISESTIKAHVSEVLHKLGVYSRARAIATLASIDVRLIENAAKPDARLN
jgi:ATP/maltotriose-dependent transcriptional regulator MalT